MDSKIARIKTDLSHYTPAHQKELISLLNSDSWQQAIDSGLVKAVKKAKIDPGETIDYIETVVKQLMDFNSGHVKDLIAKGNSDATMLLDELSKWPADLNGQNPILSFIGFNVTADCNFDPKCEYCNQPEVTSAVDGATWKKAIADVAGSNHPDGTYIYITGGEPLNLGETIWGDDGLVRFAAERGVAVNINTNATQMTPDIGLKLIKAGLAKLHISLDSANPDIQNFLFGGDRFSRVMEGIYHIQLARDLTKASYPVIHTNCVLTAKNLDLFPELFAFILEKHKQTVNGSDPFYNDLFPHVIPVGGLNEQLRPSEAGFRKFYEEIWPMVTGMWDDYQAERDVPKEKRGILFGYFSNPFLRVAHKNGLDAYVKTSEKGRYGELALARHCYVAPTQASFTPDGNQYRCGSHAIRRIHSLGNINQQGIFENIKQGIKDLDQYPNPDDCYGCALATLYINQSVEQRLNEAIKALMDKHEKR